MGLKGLNSASHSSLVNMKAMEKLLKRCQKVVKNEFKNFTEDSGNSTVPSMFWEVLANKGCLTVVVDKNDYYYKMDVLVNNKEF